MNMSKNIYLKVYYMLNADAGLLQEERRSGEACAAILKEDLVQATVLVTKMGKSDK